MSQMKITVSIMTSNFSINVDNLLLFDNFFVVKFVYISVLIIFWFMFIITKLMLFDKKTLTNIYCFAIIKSWKHRGKINLKEILL